MTTGAVAAPVFLAILNALDATEPQASDISAYLATIASRADTLAWAVLIGALSPAVWSMGESLVKARFAIADTQLDAMKKSVASAAKDLKGQQVKVDQAIAKVVDAAAKAPSTSGAAAPPVTTLEVNRVAGVIETELGSDVATVVRKALEANGGSAVAPPCPLTRSRGTSWSSSRTRQGNRRVGGVRDCRGGRAHRHRAAAAVVACRCLPSGRCYVSRSFRMPGWGTYLGNRSPMQPFEPADGLVSWGLSQCCASCWTEKLRRADLGLVQELFPRPPKRSFKTLKTSWPPSRTPSRG